MGTITVSIKNDVEKRFRETAAKIYGQRKGYLGSALTEAMLRWITKVRQEELKAKAIKRLDAGYEMGKLLYKSRGELHER